MPRNAAILASVALVSLTGAPAAARPTGTKAPSRATVSVDSCHSGATGQQRYAIFTGQMTAVPRTATMGMRFALLGRALRAPAYRRLPAPELGVWQRSASGVQIFRYRQVVTNLPARGVFRGEVDFRWYDSLNHVIRHAYRRSPRCQMRDQRPALAVASIVAHPQGGSSSERYDVAVLNKGPGAAGSFDVVLSVGGDALAAQTVSALGAGESSTLTFTGPHCPAGSTLQATADPQKRVEQRSRAQDVKSSAC